MLTVCWAAKGGSGTTVVTCALALASGAQSPSWLVDLAGDTPAALGIAEPNGPGVRDWISSTSAPTGAFDALGAAASAGLRVVPRGSANPSHDHPRWDVLGRFLAARDEPVFVDAGTGRPPPALLAAAQHRLLVTRPCYLALRRAAASTLIPKESSSCTNPAERCMQTTSPLPCVHPWWPRSRWIPQWLALSMPDCSQPECHVSSASRYGRSPDERCCSRDHHLCPSRRTGE